MRRLVLAVLPAVVLAGCSTSVDQGKAEKLVEKAARSVGAEVKGASCPDGLTAKKGLTFSCDVTGADGSTGKIPVLVKDADGNAVVKGVLLRPAKVEGLVGDTIRKQVTGRRVTSRCPDIVVARTGGIFVCHVTGDDGTKGDVQGKTTDNAGNVTVDANFLHTGTAEQEIATSIERQSGVKSVDVTCPAILLPDPGGTFECRAVGGGDSVTVIGTQTNDKGGFTYRTRK